MNVNVSTSKNQVTDNKKLLFPVRVEYKIMEDFKRTLSKRPWEYLEEGNYEKYLKASEVKKEPSVHRKELLEVYSEILALIKDKQRHINTQFVDPKYDLVKHDFKCICNNTIKFQYYHVPYEHQKSTKEVKVSEKKKSLGSEYEFKVKELDFDKLKDIQISKDEKPQFVSSRMGSEHTGRDPVVEEYFDAGQVKPVGTKLKKKSTKKMDKKESIKREGTKIVKFDGVSDDSLNKYLDSDRTSTSDVPKKYKRKETLKELGLPEHKNTFDANELMCMPSLDLDGLLGRKVSYKREPKVEPKANVVSPPVKVPSSTKKSSDNLNLEVDKLSHQEAEMRNDLLHLLESVPIFSDLPKNRLLEIIKHFKLKSYFAKSSIILAGEVPQEFFIVASGTVSSYTYEDNTKSCEYKRTYLCSEYFGETLLMEDKVSNEFYVADSHVTVQTLSASVFKTVLADLFDAFRNRNREFSNYSTYRINTLMAPSVYFTNMELDKFASGDNTIKAKSVLGPKLMEFLNSYKYLSKFKYLEKLSKRFSYQEYLAKEILVGVCRNDNLFLVYEGTVSLQVYEEELNRQLELVSFGPGTFFFKFKYKSDLVGSLMERSSFVAKEKVVLLCLEDKYVEKYLKDIVLEMSDYLENLYKSSYLTLEKNKYKYLHSDRSSSSSRTVYSDVEQSKEEKLTQEEYKEEDVEEVEISDEEEDNDGDVGVSGDEDSHSVEQKENEVEKLTEQEDDKSVEQDESVSNVSLKSEEVSDRTDVSSVVSSSSTSVLSSTSREDSSRHTRSDGPGDDKFDDSYSKKTSSVDNYSEQTSDLQSKISDQRESTNATKDDKSVDQDESVMNMELDKEQVLDKKDTQKDVHEEFDKTKVSKRFSGSFSFTGAIVSRKSFDDPADVSIRSSVPNQIESSRTVSSIDSSILGKLQPKVFKKDELSGTMELESSKSLVTTEKDDESLLTSSLNKLNEVLKTVGVKNTDSGSDKSLDEKESFSSKSSVKSLASSKDDTDFMNNLFNKIGGYKAIFKSDSNKDSSVSEKHDETSRKDSDSDKDKKEEKLTEQQDLDIKESIMNMELDKEQVLDSYRSISSIESLINKNYPSVQESIDSVIDVIRTKSLEFNSDGTLTDLDVLNKLKEEKLTEQEDLDIKESIMNMELDKEQVLDKDEGAIVVKTVGKVNVDEEDFIRRSIEEDYEIIRKNTLLASHVNISDTELSSRSQRSNLLNQSSISSLLRTKSNRSERTEYTENKYSSIREGSSFKESSNIGKDSKDSEVSSVGSDVKFIFNLDSFKSSEYKPPMKQIVNLPKLKEQQVVDDSVDQKENEEEKGPDSSRVMGNDNFVDIRNLSSYYSSELNNLRANLSMSDMGIAKIYEEMESLLQRERSEMSGKVVYRNTTSSHLLTSRTTNENVLEPEDLSSVAKELGEVIVEQVESNVEVPTLDINRQEDQGLTLTGLKTELSKNKENQEEKLTEQQDLDKKESIMNMELDKEQVLDKETDLVETMGTVDKLGTVEEKDLEKSPSLDFAEIPSFKKIISRGYDMYVNPDLPVESVSGSKFPSIDEEYVQLDQLEKLYRTKTFDEVVKEEEVIVVESKDMVDLPEKTENKEEEGEEEFESLFDLNRLYRQSSYTSNNTLSENIYDSDRDEVVPDEISRKDSDSDKDKKEKGWSREFSLSIDKLTSQLSIENLTNDLSFDNIKRELSNIGSSISSQISEAFSSKTSEVDEQEVKEQQVVDDSVDQKENEDSRFSLFAKPKLIITSIFDNIPLYNSGDENKENEEEKLTEQQDLDKKESELEQKDEEDNVQLDVKKEVEQLLNNRNVLIDKCNLVSRISLDSPSNVTSTSSSDREIVLSKQKESELYGDMELESSKSLVTTEKDDESLLTSEKEDKYDLLLKSPENVAIDDGLLSTYRSDETLSSLKTSTVKSSVSSEDEDSPVEQKENEVEPDLSSNVGKDSKDSEVSSFRDEKESTMSMPDEKVLSSSTDKSDGDGQVPLRVDDDFDGSVVTIEKDDESLLSSMKDEIESHKSFVTTDKDTDKCTEKSLISSVDKSDKNQFYSSISATESIHDTSFLSTDSESHITSSSDSVSYDYKDNSIHETEGELESNQDDVASVISSMTNNTYNTDNSDLQSKSSEPLDSGRLSNAESLDNYSKRTSSIDSLLTSEKEDGVKTSVQTESESSRSSSLDSNFDSSDQHESTNATKEEKENKEYKQYYGRDDNRNLDDDTDSFSDVDSDYVEQKENEEEGHYLSEQKDVYELDNDFEMLEETVDSEEEEEEFEYDEESILSIKNLLMSTLKNKYKSLGTSFISMDFERSGKVTREIFLSFIEKLGIGAIDHREQNLMFELLKEENQDYITFASFYKCSGETITTLAELNQHFISIFGSSRIAFERFFNTLKKSTMCSQVDFVLMLNQIGIGEDHANKLFDMLDVCKTQNVTVLTMLKMIVGDWDENVALENEQKLNTKLNRLLSYWSPESIEEFDTEFTTTLSSQFFDQSVEGSLVNNTYEEFGIEHDLKYFDQLSSLLSEKKEFSGVSLAQKRFIVSLFNIIDTSTTPQEAFMTESGEINEQDVFLVSSGEVEAPLVALISGNMKMDFEGITNFNLKHANLTLPCLPNYQQFISSVENFNIQTYMSGYYDNQQGTSDFNQPRTECGYSLSFKLGPNRNTVVGLLPLSVYLYNVLPILNERNRRIPVMLQFLKSIPSFNVYSNDELDKIVSACTVKQFKLHETVIRMGETPTHFYLVFDGTLTVTNDYNIEFKTVGKSEFFSSYDLVNNKSNNFTLIANCSLVLLSWERNEFFRVFNKYSTLVENDSCNLNDFENLGQQKLVDKKVSFAECP